ncbi:MAG: hypothetical protein RDV41_03365, partial [Planctomycetota bacterium]|nr:hypothetical protein [Planctomycetota bacterium]
HEAVCSYPSKFIWLCSVFYATCAILRLARFNVEHVAESESHEVFQGLPSPGAAGFVVSMVLCFMFLLFLRDVPSSTVAASTPPLAHEVSRTLWFLPKAIAYALPFLAVGCGVLMVSRLSYVHVLNRFLTRRTPLFRLVQLALLLLVVLAIGPEVSAAFVFASYILSGPISYYFWRRKHLSRKLGSGVRPAPTRTDLAEGEHDSEEPR